MFGIRRRNSLIFFLGFYATFLLIDLWYFISLYFFDYVSSHFSCKSWLWPTFFSSPDHQTHESPPADTFLTKSSEIDPLTPQIASSLSYLWIFSVNWNFCWLNARLHFPNQLYWTNAQNLVSLCEIYLYFVAVSIFKYFLWWFCGRI